MKKFLALIMALALVLGLAACGTTPAGTDEPSETDAVLENLVFGTNAEFPPFESVSPSGVISSADGTQSYDGIDMKIAQLIGEQNGYNSVINNIEFDSLLIALENGQIDAVIAGMTITEDRKKSVDFTTPYYTATQVMIVKEESDITCAADMEGKGIAVVQGYTGETCVKELGFEYEAFKKGTECVLELVNGKCDVVVIDSATAQKYVGDNEGLKIVEDAEAFDAEEYGIAVKKGNTELLNMLNASIEGMLADGTISELAVAYTEAE